jgi:hypothetical protein
MFKAVLNGNVKRCKAKAKSTGEQCKCPCAYGQAVCHKHGANPHPVSGKKSHFYKTGSDTRKSRRELAAKMKELKVYEKLLADDKPIFEIPLDTPEAKLINKISDKAFDQIIKAVVKTVDKKHKTKNSPVNKPQ